MGLEDTAGDKAGDGELTWPVDGSDDRSGVSYMEASYMDGSAYEARDWA